MKKLLILFFSTSVLGQEAVDLDSGPAESPTFTPVANSIVNTGPLADNPFWIGMPDINGDGCLDLFIGTHIENSGGESRMWLQDVTDDACQKTFVYYDNMEANYSQGGTPRITSRYVFANVTGKSNGLPDFFGSDADIGNSALYTPITGIGEPPVYSEKVIGCKSGDCISADINGDGNIEFIDDRNLDATEGMIYDPVDKETLVASIDSSMNLRDNNTPYMPLDIDRDGYPDLVNLEDMGYWLYDPAEESFGEFFPAFQPRTDVCRSTATRNYQWPIDYDNDGDFDILYASAAYNGNDCNYSEFYLFLYRNNGDGTFTDVTDMAGSGTWTDGSLSNTTYSTTYSTGHVADFNNDGCDDFVISHHTRSGGTNFYINQCDGTFETVEGLIPPYGSSQYQRPWAAIGDYDNDGDIDLAYLANNSGNVEGFEIFRNEGNENNWMKARARGPEGNTDGYHTDLIWSYNGEILAHKTLGHFSTGYYSFIAHAGLGGAERIDLTVHYPHDGESYTYSDLDVNQEVVVYPDGCLIAGWIPGNGWPETSEGQHCIMPD